MATRIHVGLVIEMTDKQVDEYAAYAELPKPLRARDVAKDVRSFTRLAAQSAFENVAEGADVSIKER